jgi:hypothetical protein
LALQVNREAAKRVLDSGFAEALKDFRRQQPPEVPDHVEKAFKRLFTSATQAYREALLGCIVARIVDDNIDIRYPHTELADNAFSGRSLDEQVINPFLKKHEIPCSNGPYLSSLRRGVALALPVPKGQRDQEGFKQMALLVDELRKSDKETAILFLRYMLYMFLLLREESKIEIVRVERLSIEQYKKLLNELLATPSGGRFPVFVVVAVLKAIKEYFGLDWEIEWQKINAPDAPSRAEGDITIKRNGGVILAIEVTERRIDETRVRNIFRAKISTYSINDYIFFFTGVPPENGAKRLAKQYFAQGHHVGFLSVEEWAINILGTIGPEGRKHFDDAMIELLSEKDVPNDIKVTWNRYLEDAIT